MSSMFTMVCCANSKVFKRIRSGIFDLCVYVFFLGRINIVRLQTLLNVDISYIETEVNEIVKDDKNLYLILGQIISK